ncbi:hypothetical protein Unana1_00221 [Umbelopsis nana]
MATPTDLVQELAKRETLAEDILTDKQLIIDSDRKRNTNREALTNIRKKLVDGRLPAKVLIDCEAKMTYDESLIEQKLWINIGDMFIKLPKKDIQNMIEEDQKKLDQEIERRRNMVKKRALKLDQLEQLQPNGRQLAGYDLQGLKASDLYHIRNQKVEEREL